MDVRNRWPLPGHHSLRDRLLAAYADPARSYHDVRHLAEVLDRLDDLAEHGSRFAPTVVRLAAWFHDAVYDGRPSAEERSARWAEEALRAPGVEDGDAAEVARLVRLTEHHDPAADDLDGAALSDADLAILAAPSDRYREYAAAVRREYASLPDPSFRSGRVAVLRALLARPSVFSTAYAVATWESPARRNVTAELEQLERTGE